MLNILLNIIGIILVIYSIFIIQRDISMKKNTDQNTVTKESFDKEIDNGSIYESNDEVVKDFDLLMDNKTQLSNIKYNEADNKSRVKQPYNKTIAIIQDEIISSKDDDINPLHKKIMELESIGLSNEEIAKKMGRGVREIDIILKIYKK